MSTYRYPYTIACDEAGFYLVKFPDLPGAATDGKTREEALAEAEDCLAEAIAGYLVRRERVPESTYTNGDAFISLDPLLSAKAALNIRRSWRAEYLAHRVQRVSAWTRRLSAGSSIPNIRATSALFFMRQPFWVSRLKFALSAPPSGILAGFSAFRYS